MIEASKSGLLFTMGNIAEIAEKIGSIISNPRDLYRLGANGRHYVEIRFNQRVSINQYQRLLIRPNFAKLLSAGTKKSSEHRHCPWILIWDLQGIPFCRPLQRKNAVFLGE